MTNSTREQGMSFASFLKTMSPEERERANRANRDLAAKQHKDFKEKFAKGICFHCGKVLTSFNAEEPCPHWLLKPGGFEKKHIEPLTEKFGWEGDDKYLFGAGGGQDQITNGVVGNSGPSGELQLGSNIATNQVWFQRSGNDLVATLMGSQDRVTIAGWYSDSYAQLSDIKTSDGHQIDTGLSQLVQAMATYSSQNPGFDLAATSQAPDDTALQSALAAAWH